MAPRVAPAVPRVLALLLLPCVAHAQLTVELRGPDNLRAGDTAEILVIVRGASRHPLLVTPRSEGTAVEVVRGRLLRADALDPNADALELRVPIVARAPGTAVVRVRASGYACHERCRAIEAEASLVLRVAPNDAKRGRKQDARSSSLSWARLEGAEACMGSAALARAIEAALGRAVFVSASEAELAVEGRVERTATGFRAVFHVTDAEGHDLGERVLESEAQDCAELDRLAVTTLALTIDPLIARREIDREIVVEERIVREVEERVVQGPRWRVEIDGALAGVLGLLPAPTIGGLLTVTLEPPGFVPISLEGALIPFSRAEPSAGHADFLHLHAGLSICPLAVEGERLALHACAGADAGAVLVIGGTLSVPERERLIGQAHLVVRGYWRVAEPLVLRIGLHLLVPFRHDAFRYLDGMGALQAFYSPDPIAGLLDLGLGLRF